MDVATAMRTTYYYYHYYCCYYYVLLLLLLRSPTTYVRYVYSYYLLGRPGTERKLSPYVHTYVSMYVRMEGSRSRFTTLDHTGQARGVRSHHCQLSLRQAAAAAWGQAASDNDWLEWGLMSTIKAAGGQAASAVWGQATAAADT